MITVKENTTLVGVSEFRGKIDKILAKIQSGHVVIEKRHKTVAVLMSPEEYKKNQEYIETAEDIVLGFIAQERDTKSSEKDYIEIEKLLK